MRKLLFCQFLYFLISYSNITWAQESKVYRNEWINYSQPYLRISVAGTGIYKIKLSSLPDKFKVADPANLQIWRNGKEVAIIKADKDEIIFYGEKNTGLTDSELYRPASARLNPYISIYSDQSSYFLTVGKSGKRATLNGVTSLSGDIEDYHLQKDIYTFTDQFSFNSYASENSLNNSFYEKGNNFTSATFAGDSGIFNSVVKVRGFLKDLVFRNRVKDISNIPTLELLVNGLQEGAHEIHISLSKSKNEGFNEVDNFPLMAWDAERRLINIKHDNISVGDSTFLKVESKADNSIDWFGIGYLKVSYNQYTDLGKGADARKSYIFNYPPSAKLTSRIGIKNVTASTKLLDISDPSSPIVIEGKLTTDLLEAMVPRSSSRETNILAYDGSTEVKEIKSDLIAEVNFQPLFSNGKAQVNSKLEPTDFNYIIITTEKLKQSAIEYAGYRMSQIGGAYEPVVVEIKSIYDQFNYGDPSPIAIRHFVDYMLSAGNRTNRHNVLLIGPTITFSRNFKKELVDEIPTFGDPGSDILLVAGLDGENLDVPAVPIGRIAASADENVLDYLEKVKIFEQDSDMTWRKKVLHLNGGHSVSEINQLKGILEDLKPMVVNGPLNGEVQAFVKSNPSTGVELVNISPQVNSGVGMITYFGHGSIGTTDLNPGYASDINRGYTKNTRFPLMYFNGCGVGNIFYQRSPLAMSADWLLAKEKGAIGVIANSYLSYVSPSSKHLKELYKVLYEDVESISMGHALIKVAKGIVNSNPNSYDIANIHQSNLQGDPAVVLFKSALPDYAFDLDDGIRIYSEKETLDIQNSKVLNIKSTVINKGKYIANQNVEIEAKVSYEDGTSLVERKTFGSLSTGDGIDFQINNAKPISKINIAIDPEKRISETDKDNNKAELKVEWAEAKSQQIYPTLLLYDKVAPVLDVTINKRIINNQEAVVRNSVGSFVLLDNVSLQGGVDSSLVDVFIKKCWDESCNFKRLTYGEDLKLVWLNENKLNVVYQMSQLEVGSYQLLINARDKSQNALTNSKVVSFSIFEDEGNDLKITVSPNPATDYVKIKTERMEIKSFNFFLYDQKGVLKSSNNVIVNSTDVNERVWNTDGIGSGLYLYKIIVTDKNGNAHKKTGQVVIIR